MIDENTQKLIDELRARKRASVVEAPLASYAVSLEPDELCSRAADLIEQLAGRPDTIPIADINDIDRVD